MPTLLELQRDMARAMLSQDSDAIAAAVAADGLAAEARLEIYRGTFVAGATRALRHSYPAVERLVGAEFFEAAARRFIDDEPPQGCGLNDYSPGFADFLADFPPAASVVYLADVARLEWAVQRALHAEDAAPLDLAALASLEAGEHDRVRFVAHPSTAFVRSAWPVDAIWRAVIAEDDAAMAAIDLADGPVRLLVQRQAGGVEVERLDEATARFLAELDAGMPLGAAIAAAPGIDAPAVLAGQLAAGGLVGFGLGEEATEGEGAL